MSSASGTGTKECCVSFGLFSLMPGLSQFQRHILNRCGWTRISSYGRSNILSRCILMPMTDWNSSQNQIQFFVTMQHLSQGTQNDLLLSPPRARSLTPVRTIAAAGRALSEAESFAQQQSTTTTGNGRRVTAGPSVSQMRAYQ